MRRTWAAPGLVALALAVSACADDGPGGSSGRAEPNGQSVRVQSLDNTFRPGVIEITGGTEVVFTNDGRNDHDVLASDGAAWGVAVEMFAPGDEYRVVFTQPGEYPYYCSIHGTADVGMIGTIVVSG